MARDWRSLSINSSGSALLNHTFVRYGGQGYQAGGIINNGGNLTIINSTADYNGEAGVRNDGGSIQVNNSVFSFNLGNGIYTTDASPVITGSVFTNNTGSGLFITAFYTDITPLVQDNQFTNNAEAGVNITSDYYAYNVTITPILTGNDFIGNGIAASISNSQLVGNPISGNIGSLNTQNGIWLRGTTTISGSVNS